MSQHIFVVVKGPLKDAVISANQRAVVLHYPCFHKPSQSHPGEVHALVDGECFPEIVQWFHADRDAGKYEAGSLLWYNQEITTDQVKLHQRRAV